MNDGDFVIFKEEQKSGQLWVQILALLIALFLWSRTIQGLTQGTISGLISYLELMVILIPLGILFPVYMLLVKQVTEVRSNSLCIYTDPFHYGFKDFSLKDIKSYEVRELSLSRDNRIGGTYVGGSGYGAGTDIPLNEYIAKGNNIIEVEFNSGQKIKIGTQRPDELATVISRGMDALS